MKRMMKRSLIILILASLFISPASCGMSEEREGTLFDSDGIVITPIGFEWSDDAILDIQIENSSRKRAVIYLSSAAVNGYIIDTQFIIRDGGDESFGIVEDISSGASSVIECALRFNPEGLDICGIKEAYDIELAFTAEYPDDGYKHTEGKRKTVRLKDREKENVPEGTVICERDGIKISVLSMEKDIYSDICGLIYFENGSDKDISVVFDEPEGVGEIHFTEPDIYPGAKKVSKLLIGGTEDGVSDTVGISFSVYEITKGGNELLFRTEKKEFPLGNND